MRLMVNAAKIIATTVSAVAVYVTVVVLTVVVRPLLKQETP
jgi:hypothetical protein